MNLDFTSSYILAAINEERRPETAFFRDRYFPTGEDDIFKADKVLTEYKKGSRKMAAFVAPRVGDVPVERGGYEIHEYTPAYIGLSIGLTVDELMKRGFGESLYVASDPATRAKKLLSKDMTDLDKRITRREEWMCVQTMINNGCDMVEISDEGEEVDTKTIRFYDGSSDHTYTVGSGYKWNGVNGNILGDVRAMCRMLTRRGLPASDLVIGSDVEDAILKNSELRELLKKDSGIRIGNEIEEKIVNYAGINRLGWLNFGGHNLEIFVADESYEADNGDDTPYFPAKGAMVTAPGCGHLMYAQITQMNKKTENFETFAARRVPKLVIDDKKDYRGLRLACRPLAAPHDYCPWIYAADVVS